MKDHEGLDESEQSARAGWLRRSADDDDLVETLAPVSYLSTARLGLEDLLTRVATSAARAVPGADGAGLTLTDPDRRDTIVTSVPFVEEIDDIQYRIGEGPCISAAAGGQVMRSGSLGTDTRWAPLGSRAARLGVHSVLSLPLATPDGVLGAINVYAHAEDAFDDHAEHLGQLFSRAAARALCNTQIMTHTHRLAVSLEATLARRAVIDQAIGIVMSRVGGTAEQALDRLRTLSQHEHTELATVAARIVGEAVARARRADT